MTTASFIRQWMEADTSVAAHTSGSTGAPKPIALSKSDISLSAAATIDFFDISPSDLLVLPLSPDYIAGKMMIVRAMMGRASLWTEPPSRRPMTLLGPEVSVKLAAIVPQQIEGAIEARCKIRHIIVGGDAVPPDLEQKALTGRPDTSWWATYGMTETCSHVALRPFGSDTYTALPGVSFTTGPDGCLVISRRGASWSPVITRDIVELISPASFRFIGRADNAIVSGALKIHPEEVERLISPAMGKRRFYVTSRPSALWGREVVVAVEGEADPDGGEALLARLASLTGPVKRPRGVIFSPSFAMTDSGKIRRQTFD